MRADIVHFFDYAARDLGVSPHRLADVVNVFDDMTSGELERLHEETGIEIVDICALRAKLRVMLESAS